MPLSVDDIKKLAQAMLDEMCLDQDNIVRYQHAMQIEEKNFTSQGQWNKLIDLFEKQDKHPNPFNLVYMFLLGLTDHDPLALRYWYPVKGHEKGTNVIEGPAYVVKLVTGEKFSLHFWQKVMCADGIVRPIRDLVSGQQLILCEDGQAVAIKSCIKGKNKHWHEVLLEPDTTPDQFICEGEYPFVMAGSWREWTWWQSNDVPDIDVDFSPSIRGELKVWIGKEFGIDRVSSIANYNTFKLKSALKDVARVFEVPFEEVNDLTKQLDAMAKLKGVVSDDEDDDGEDLQWEEAKRVVPDLKEFESKYPEVVDIARRLIGRRCRLSVHAGGVVISREPIQLSVPVVAREKDKVWIPIAAYTEGQNRSDLKTFGQVKYDILGLSTLEDIAGACKRIYKRYVYIETDKGFTKVLKKDEIRILDENGQHKIIPVIDVKPGHKVVANVKKNIILTVTNVPLPFDNVGMFRLDLKGDDWQNEDFLNDAPSLAMAAQGHTLSIFQFDSILARRTCKDLMPTNFEDLTAITTIIRPGALGIGADKSYVARKHKQEKWEETTHPVILADTRETYGLPIYQEQIMMILHHVGKLPLPDCEKIRKAMSTKKEEVFMKFKEAFIQGAQETVGWTREEAEDYWGFIRRDEVTGEEESSGLMSWASYGFNRSIVLSDTFTLHSDGTCKAMAECKPGDMIMAYDPITSIPFYDEVIKLHENGIKQVYGLELSNGATIQCTLDHEFLCEDGKKRYLYEVIDQDLKIVSMNFSCPKHPNLTFDPDLSKTTFCPCSIVKVTKLGKVSTGDLEMKSDTHNFIANGIVAGNSHAIGYTKLSMKCLYLKRHFPKEWWASVLSGFVAGKPQIKDYISEAIRVSKIKFKTVDVNSSGRDWIIAGDKVNNEVLVMPLSQIKGIGESSARIAEIAKRSKYTDFDDFLRRFGSPAKTINALIKAGAFDSLHPNRAALYEYFAQYKSLEEKVLIGTNEFRDWLKELEFITPEMRKKILLSFGARLKLAKLTKEFAKMPFDVFKEWTKGNDNGTPFNQLSGETQTNTKAALAKANLTIEDYASLIEISAEIKDLIPHEHVVVYVDARLNELGYRPLSTYLCCEEWDIDQKLEFEEEAFGFVLPFSHPLTQYISLDKAGNQVVLFETTSSLNNKSMIVSESTVSYISDIDKNGVVDCRIVKIEEKKSKEKGTKYYRLKIDDSLQVTSVMVWSDVMDEYKDLLKEGSYVRLSVTPIDKKWNSCSIRSGSNAVRKLCLKP